MRAGLKKMITFFLLIMMYYYSIFIGICTEEGLIDDGCFDAALQHVHQTLELVYFPQYLHSAFYAKHQLEAFTSNGGSGITMKGILHNEVLFFHFMEFLENEGM